MSLKRILDKQLELNEYDPFGGGVHWDDQEAKDINRLAECYKHIQLPKKNEIMGNFLQEVKSLTKNYNSPKIEEIKTRIKVQAASGKTSATFNYDLYDRDVINWLRAEGLTVEEISDQRDGDFIVVKW